MYRAIAANRRNTVLIMVFFIVIIAGLGYVASLYWGNWTITIWALVGAAIYATIQYFAASKLAVASAGAVEIQRDDNPRLWRIVENLSITTGTPMPKVYIMQDPSPNAFATGRDPNHAIVCATTGLLEIMTDRELEGVMAHELGHVRNYDIRVSMIVFGLVAAIGVVADILTRMTFWSGMSGNNRNSNNNNGGNAIFMILGLVAALIAPLLAGLVQLAISRQREYLADATGALTTRDPEGLASALAKLEEYGKPLKKQNSSMSHMYISNPLSGSAAKLFATHPPIPDRIRRLLDNATKF